MTSFSKLKQTIVTSETGEYCTSVEEVRFFDVDAEGLRLFKLGTKLEDIPSEHYRETGFYLES